MFLGKINKSRPECDRFFFCLYHISCQYTRISDKSGVLPKNINLIKRKTYNLFDMSHDILQSVIFISFILFSIFQVTLFLCGLKIIINTTSSIFELTIT
jgi:hypothetical protein